MTKDIDRESLKAQRVKSFFIQAAKEIILTEGYENATVRNIAAEAGYAVSTLYQYFENIEQLQLEVKKTLIFDLMTKVQQHVVEGSYSVADIKAQNHAFLDFFIEQPHVYPFFYLDLDSSSMGNFDNLVFTEEYFSLYEGFVERGIIQKKDIPNVAKIIIYSLNGMLRLYFSNHGLTKEDVYADLDNIIDFLLTNE